MYQINASPFPQSYAPAGNNPDSNSLYARRQALGLFRSARLRGGLAGVLARLSRRPNRLLDLGRLGLRVRSSNYAGIRPVSLDRVIGSEGRCSDFDARLNPLHERSRDRWLSVAAARLAGQALPAVELIQVGAAYFVRDGHHRISVARALGEEAIDAQVVVWDVAGPLPWERESKNRYLAVQPA